MTTVMIGQINDPTAICTLPRLVSVPAALPILALSDIAINTMPKYQVP
jgi:hypothetical protein